ncbi:MAG: hypothetical protein Fur0032_08280 [Terrimicrobiaceae bacterium]
MPTHSGLRFHWLIFPQIVAGIGVVLLGIGVVTGCAGKGSGVSTTKKTMKIPAYNSIAPGAGAFFTLTQPWQESPEAGFQPGEVRLSWAPEKLVVVADLSDRDVKTLATAHNQKLWKLGDVFEVFVQVEGREDYAEMHVAPNNQQMHLKLPRVGWRPSPDAEPLTFDQVLVSSVGFYSETIRTPTGWYARLEIPAEVLGLKEFRPGEALRISFCRYDYNGDREPVLSTTAKHRKVAFHQPGDWTRILLENKLAGP